MISECIIEFFPAGEIASVMELSYRFIELPKGLVSSIDFNQLEGKVFKDSKNPKTTYSIHGKAKQTELGKLPLIQNRKFGFLESKSAGVLEYNQAFSWSV